MPSPSDRLGLLVPARTDQFVTGDIATNLEVLDDHPGYYVCTSTTRPTWGAAQAGMLISETDTRLLWRWTGTGWERSGPKGLMTQVIQNANLSTTSTTFAIPAASAGAGGIMATPVVTWPDGHRTAMVVISFNYAYNNVSGLLDIGLSRGIVNNTVIQHWQWAGDNDGTGGTGAKGAGTTLILFDPNLGPGTYQWALQLRAVTSGTAIMSAVGAGGIRLAVIEV